jgi:hypothetical protein
MLALKDLAYILRSKNAGSFHITFDIMFRDEDTYKKVKARKYITKDKIAILYKVKINDVKIFEYDQAYAIKVTIPRQKPNGDIDDTDVFGCQQHTPLMELSIEN